MGQHPHSRLRAGRTHRRSAYEPLPGPLPQSRTHLGHQTVTAHPDPQPSPATTRTCAVAVLTGLRPSPTRHAVVTFGLGLRSVRVETVTGGPARGMKQPPQVGGPVAPR